GVVQYWFNGHLIIDRHDVLFRTGARSDLQFAQCIIGPYIGRGSAVDQTMWVDNLIVASQRPWPAELGRADAARPQHVSGAGTQPPPSPVAPRRYMAAGYVDADGFRPVAGPRQVQVLLPGHCGDHPLHLSGRMAARCDARGEAGAEFGARRTCSAPPGP